MEERSVFERVFGDLQSRGYDVTVGENYKNNEKIRGIGINFGDGDVSPYISEETIEHLYEVFDGDVTAVTDELIKTSEDLIVNLAEDTERMKEQLKDRNYIIQNSYLFVCKSDWNNEMLEDMYFERIDGTDLVLYPRLVLDNGCTVRLDRKNLESVGLRGEDVMDAARANTEKELEYDDILSMGFMVVLNVAKGGASVIAFPEYLKYVMEGMGWEKAYILPSSIYEVMMIEASNTISVDNIRADIRYINETTVCLCDRLSDQVYYFDGEKVSVVE